MQIAFTVLAVIQQLSDLYWKNKEVWAKNLSQADKDELKAQEEAIFRKPNWQPSGRTA